MAPYDCKMSTAVLLLFGVLLRDVSAATHLFMDLIEYGLTYFFCWSVIFFIVGKFFFVVLKWFTVT